jgi:hypothetical protein
MSTSGFHCAWACCEMRRFEGRELRRESEGLSRMSAVNGLDGGVEKVSFSGPGETMVCMFNVVIEEVSFTEVMIGARSND